MMNYGNIKWCDIANGLGIRVSLFVSGCTHHCKNCFNPETWNEAFGVAYTKEVEDSIISRVKSSFINGLSLLGGEPLEPNHIEPLLSLVKRVKSECENKNIWVYSGYTWEQLINRTDNTIALLSFCDILVDGEFKDDLKDIRLKYRGSSNQRIIDIQKSLQKKKVFLIDSLM